MEIFFCGALSYADDIILLAPTVTSQKWMLSICEHFANDYDVVFNTGKNKSLVFPDLGVIDINISLMGGVIEHVSDYGHLGYIIGSECDSINIQCCISYFYAKLYVLFRDLYYVNFVIKSSLMKTYCMTLYGCPLWELDGKNIDVAWRKGIRRLLGVPYNTHCELNLICNEIPIDSQIDKRVYTFLASCKESDNSLTKLCYNLACYGSQSTVGNNISFLCSKYGLFASYIYDVTDSYRTCF